MLFSFKAVCNHDLPEQTMVLFQEQVTNNRDKEINENEIFKIYIKNSMLNVQIQNDILTIDNFLIQKDQFYIISVVQNEIGFFGGSKSKVFFNLNKVKSLCK